ncbi:hypothetical protein V1264_011106 [Littorina saxatilis]
MASGGGSEFNEDFPHKNTVTGTFSAENQTCALCEHSVKDGEDPVVQTEKGVQGLLKASQSRCDGLQFVVGQVVHRSCRYNYCNTNVIKRDLKRKRDEAESQQEISTVSLRSSKAKFDIRNDCLFCGLPAKSDAKKGISVFSVRTFNFQEKLLQVCSDRGEGDKWAETVRMRIHYAQDLHAYDAMYHHQCSVNFRTKRNVPLAFRSDSNSMNCDDIGRPGRPAVEERNKAFLRVAKYLEENDDEQTTLGDLCKKMLDHLTEADPYTERHMKTKLLDHFGGAVIITSIQGKANVVTFRSTAEKILKQFSEAAREKDVAAEKIRIIKTASKLLLADIKDMISSKETYPSPTQIGDLPSNLQYLPPSLVLFLKTLLHEKKEPDIKVAAIGQALAQAARPKILLAPLQVGLAVELHHLFGSKFIVEHVNKLGFCSSYAEVRRFEQCAAVSQGVDLYGTVPDSRIQFVADNVDHNIRTLDGTGTFHGMGIIASATPCQKQHNSIRRDQRVTNKSLMGVGSIPVRYFDPSTISLSLVYELLHDFSTNDDRKKLDLVWKVSWPLRSPRPGWSGTMQAVCDGQYPGRSAITFLPMIDMDPTNMSCVYSTLLFVTSLAKKNNVTPVLTFDQPLWWRAKVIVNSEPLHSDLHSLVLRLGGFHTQMSFLGCIGRLMSGSGLQQLLEVAFAPNAVLHMLSGKAVARGVRGHFLVDSVLNALISSITFGFSLDIHCAEGTDETGEEETEAEHTVNDSAPGEPSRLSEHEDPPPDRQATNGTETEQTCLYSALALFDKVLNKKMAVEELDDSPELIKIEQMLLQTKEHLQGQRMAKLWLQYMNMIDIMRRFLRAERTGNWLLHLHSLQQMLPYLAAAGHSLYAKSVHIYLQDMQQLKEHHPSVFHEFTHGYHVLRRSDRYWAGLSTDLVIEQVLMRSVKSAGGLTRGRGMGDSQRTQWLLSMPACAEMNNAMQEVTRMEYTTSDQHAESGGSRQGKDETDMKSMLKFLLPRNPFTSDGTLRNICTGVTADTTVNVDTAKAVGGAILQSMVGTSVKDFKFKRKNQAVTMDIQTSAKIEGEIIQVDPQLLFQRLVTAASVQPDEFDLPSSFEFELTSPPASLFEPSGLLRESHKSTLVDAIATAVKGETLLPGEEDASEHVILDGGSLLHKVPWRKLETFGNICKMYADYINRRYRNPVIVFDGYDSGPTTKDTAHLRRSSGAVGPVVMFTKDTVLTSRKDHFLSNARNKQAFIFMLGSALEYDGCRVLHAQADADTLIVKTAMKSAAENKTTVIGEDTDLLVLLVYHVRLTDQPVFLRSDKQSSKRRVWHIQWLKQALGHTVCQLLPFVHAINGCDTTSKLYRIGKSEPLKKIKTDSIFNEQGRIFCSRERTKEVIVAAGERALIHLYNGCKGESLDILRYKRFCEKVATCSASVDVQSLPPTSAAAKYHSLRVYLQVQEWVNLSADLAPEEWGWHLSAGQQLEPRTTDLPPAPEALLRVVRCNCKKDCQSKRCTCRKHGLVCSVACGGCKGLSCTNSPSFEELDSDLLDIPSVFGLPDLAEDMDVVLPLDTDS